MSPNPFWIPCIIYIVHIYSASSILEFICLQTVVEWNMLHTIPTTNKKLPYYNSYFEKNGKIKRKLHTSRTKQNGLLKGPIILQYEYLF